MQVEDRGPSWPGLKPTLPSWLSHLRLVLSHSGPQYWQLSILGISGDVKHLCLGLTPLPVSPQTRLQAGVGYGNTFSCIRTVYRKESVSAPPEGGWGHSRQDLSQNGPPPPRRQSLPTPRPGPGAEASALQPAHRVGGPCLPAHHTITSHHTSNITCYLNLILPPIGMLLGGEKTGEILRNLLTQCGKFLQKQGDLSGFQNQVSGQ